MSIAYSTLTVEAQRGFYKINWGFGFAILFTLTTQMTGLGLAGIYRKFLVYPSSMIWPAVLPNCALFNTLHDGKDGPDPADTNRWRIPRFRFFLCKRPQCLAVLREPLLILLLDVVLGGFLWYWIPGFLWTSLASFAWVTWIRPDNVLINQLFGTNSGYSFGAPFTAFALDWTTINGYLGSPLVVPFHAIANTSTFFFWRARFFKSKDGD
jgi:hypothetical protein